MQTQQTSCRLGSRIEVVRAALEFLKEQRAQLLAEERKGAVCRSLEYGKRDFAILLLDSGSIEDPYGECLLEAARLGDQEIIDRLLQSGEASKLHCISAAQSAAAWKHWDIARALILRAELTASDFERGSIAYEALICAAARQGDLEIIRRLWPDGKKDEQLQTRMLFSAVGGNQAETIPFILNFGPIDSATRGVMLRDAAELGFQQCVNALLLKPANALLQNLYVQVAHAAGEKGHWTVAKSLLIYGDVRISGEVPRSIFSYSENFYWKFPELHTFLTQAAEKNDLEILERLTPTKPEKLARLFRGQILCNAARQLQIPAVQFALQQGSIRKFDRGGAVHSAAYHGHLELLKTLLASGPISDLSREMARKIASFRGHLKIAKKLS